MSVQPIRVLIVDDSAIIRQAFANELRRHSGIMVVGCAPDPYQARDLIVSTQPHVITLDIEMPRMDGLAFLRKLMKFHPVPTIIVSSVTTSGCEKAIACLQSGAVEVVSKPDGFRGMAAFGNKLVRLIRAAAAADPTAPNRIAPPPMATSAVTPPPPAVSMAAPQVAHDRPPDRQSLQHRLIAIGSSTGGTEALRVVLTGLPTDMPGIVITQHMPAGFTASFAERLDSLSRITVREARNGEPIRPGHAYLAPGDEHLRVIRTPGGYITRVSGGPAVLRHRPSVEVLFESVAMAARGNALGVILTGMGGDGAGGLKSMRDAGAFTIAQDEKTSIVFGMPREAIQLGAVCAVLPLDQIPQHLVRFTAGVLKPPPTETDRRHAAA
jgi:two-component system chemotaxis response regulator CheB